MNSFDRENISAWVSQFTNPLKDLVQEYKRANDIREKELKLDQDKFEYEKRRLR